MPVQPMPTLATLDNAYRVAVARADDTDCDQAITNTGNPAQPFVVSDAAGQSAGTRVATITKGY